MHVKYIDLVYVATICVLIAALFFVLVSVGPPYTGDKGVYDRYVDDIERASFSQVVMGEGWEPAFKVLGYVASRIGGSAALFLLVVAIIVTTSAAAYRRVLPDGSYLPALLLLAAFPWFYDYTYNALRQGMAMSLSSMALAASLQRQKPKALLWLAVAIAFHFGAVVYAASVFVHGVRRLVPAMLVLWIICLWLGWVAATFMQDLADVVVTILSASRSLVDVDYGIYLTAKAAELYGSEGARIDFIALSVAVVSAFLLIVQSRRSIQPGGQFEAMWSTFSAWFLLPNAVFLLLNSIPFSDRVLALSLWFLPLFGGWLLSLTREFRIAPAIWMLLIGSAATMTFGYKAWEQFS